MDISFPMPLPLSDHQRSYDTPQGSPRGLRASSPHARKPGSYHGSTLHGGSNQASGRGPHEAYFVGCLKGMPCQVDRGIVIALVTPPTAVARPVLGPANGLDTATAAAGLRAGEEAVGLHQYRAMPAGLVAELPPDLS